jgi:hypothetical protein
VVRDMDGSQSNRDGGIDSRALQTRDCTTDDKRAAMRRLPDVTND